MTMATNGKQIEELSTEDRNREVRLRYVGAIETLIDYELRVAASRLIATRPLVTEEEFVRRSEKAYRDVAGYVCTNAFDARDEESPAIEKKKKQKK